MAQRGYDISIGKIIRVNLMFVEIVTGEVGLDPESQLQEACG